MAAATSTLGKQIQDELSCSICSELFTRPKMLPCQHTFCEDCLQGRVGSQNTFQCPTCHLQVKVPPQGITGLPENNLVTILCEGLRKQSTASVEARKQPQPENRCSFHPTEELKLYCKQCQVPVCNECLDETHSDHSTITIKKASQEKRAPIQALINEGRKILETYRGFLRGIADTEKTLQEQKQQTESSINAVYSQMALTLLKGKDHLLAEIEQSHSQNLSALQTEKDRISTNVAELSAACDKAEQAWRGGVEFLAQETTLTDILGKHRGKVAPNPIQTQVAVFQPTDATVPALGQVTIHSVPSASIQATSPTANAAARVMGHHRGNQNGHLANRVSFGGKRMETEDLALLTSLAASDDDDATSGVIGHHHGNQRRSQQHSPLVKKVSFVAFDHEGNGNQGEQQAKSMTFGGKGPDPEHFDLPSGVVVSEEGEIFVGDYKNQSVKVFTLEGTFVRQFPTVVQDGQKMEPHDVALDDGAGNLWVVGTTASAELAVQYTKRGRLLSTIDLQKTGQVRGIAVDSRRSHILITQATREVEKSNGTVQVFSPDGTLLKTVGGKLPASWQQGLKVPQFITVDGDSNILVSDCHSHLVFVYSVEGQFLFKFGGEGSEEGQLKSPQGICTDSSGNIIVADRKNSRVELFDQTGRFLQHITTNMRWPWAVAMTTQGQVVVTNADKSTVTIFPSY